MLSLNRKRSRCASGSGVDALLLDRVLRGHHQERVGQRERLAADRDLALGHDLEQRRLHLGRRAVDLVGEQEVDHHRAEFDVELLLALPVDAGADDVGGHQVGGELDAGERAADHLGERLDGQRLGHAGHALEQHVALGEQADQHPLDQLVLADDDPLDLEDRPLERVHLLLQAAVVGRAALVAARDPAGSPAPGLGRNILRRPAAAHSVTSSTVLPHLFGYAAVRRRWRRAGQSAVRSSSTIPGSSESVDVARRWPSTDAFNRLRLTQVRSGFDDPSGVRLQARRAHRADGDLARAARGLQHLAAAEIHARRAGCRRGPRTTGRRAWPATVGTLRPVLYWSPEYFGISTPTPANEYWVRPEQSKPTVLAPESTPVLGPLSLPPPHEYGTPICDPPRRITYSMACGPRTRPGATPAPGGGPSPRCSTGTCGPGPW